MSTLVTSEMWRLRNMVGAGLAVVVCLLGCMKREESRTARESTLAKAEPEDAAHSLSMERAVIAVTNSSRVEAANVAPQTVVITAKPKFELRHGSAYLQVQEGTNVVEVFWSALQMPPIVPLNSTSVYTFTFFIEEKYSLRFPQLAKVQDERGTIYDWEICALHGVKMSPTDMEIRYGMNGGEAPRPSIEQEREVFPHRRKPVFGGCVIFPNSPRTERVFVCPRCVAEYEKWRSTQAKTTE